MLLNTVKRKSLPHAPLAGFSLGGWKTPPPSCGFPAYFEQRLLCGKERGEGESAEQKDVRQRKSALLILLPRQDSPPCWMAWILFTFFLSLLTSCKVAALAAMYGRCSTNESFCSGSASKSGHCQHTSPIVLLMDPQEARSLTLHHACHSYGPLSGANISHPQRKTVNTACVVREQSTPHSCHPMTTYDYNCPDLGLERLGS